MTIHKSIEVIESPNKALIIGDSFLQYLKKKDKELLEINSDTKEGGKFELFLKTMMYKGLEMNKSSKSERVVEAITENGRKTSETIKEAIGLHFLIQYNYLDQEIKNQIFPNQNEYENIGATFAEILYTNTAENSIETTVDSILHTLKTGLQNRLQENKTLWADMGEKVVNDITSCFDLKENFFTFQERLGRKTLLPENIPFSKYPSRGLVDSETIFEGVHNIITKKQSGFDILTMLTRIKQKGIYHDLHGFFPALKNIGYESSKKSHYFTKEIRDEIDNTYKYTYAPYFDKGVKKWEDFCIEYLYRLPNTKNIDVDSLLNDLTLVYKELCSKYSHKRQKRFDEDVLAEIIDQCPDQTSKKILSYYEDKIYLVGSDSPFGKKVLLQGKEIFATISTDKSRDGNKKSVQIQLFTDEYASHPIRQSTYSIVNGLWITDDGEHNDLKYIRSIIRKKIADRNIDLSNFSPKQQELFIDGCVKSVERSLFGRIVPGIEELQGPISIGANIASAYLELPKIKESKNSTIPHTDFPKALVDTSKINTTKLIDAINQNNQRKTYSSFLPESMMQWIMYVSSEKHKKENGKINRAAYRYNEKYKNSIDLNTVKKAITGDKETLYLNCITDLVTDKLFSFGENKIEDQKRFIVQYKKELQYVVQNNSQSDRIKEFLTTFIPIADQKAKEVESKNKERLEEKKKGKTRLSTPRDILDTTLLKEAIDEIISKQSKEENFSSTIIRKKDFLNFISELETDDIFVKHTKNLLSDDKDIHINEYAILGEKEKLYYIKWLHKTGYIVPYLQKLKNIKGATELYNSTLYLWYTHFGKAQLDILIGNLHFIAKQTISNDSEEDVMNKKFNIHLEKNLLYQVLFIHFIENKKIAKEIPVLKDDISRLQIAYNAYSHQKTFQEMRTALTKMGKRPSREKIVKSIADSIIDITIIT